MVNKFNWSKSCLVKPRNFFQTPTRYADYAECPSFNRCVAYPNENYLVMNECQRAWQRNMCCGIQGSCQPNCGNQQSVNMGQKVSGGGDCEYYDCFGNAIEKQKSGTKSGKNHKKSIEKVKNKQKESNGKIGKNGKGKNCASCCSEFNGAGEKSAGSRKRNGTKSASKISNKFANKSSDKNMRKGHSKSSSRASGKNTGNGNNIEGISLMPYYQYPSCWQGPMECCCNCTCGS